LIGTLDNVGQALVLDASSGNWVLNGGTIKGGAITQTGPAKLRCTRSAQNTLDGVTLEGELDLTDGGVVRIRNGLRLTTGGVPGGTVRIDNGGILAFEGTQSFGPGTIEFAGNSGFMGPVGNVTLTLANGTLVRGKTGNLRALYDGSGTPTLIN